MTGYERSADLADESRDPIRLARMVNKMGGSRRFPSSSRPIRLVRMVKEIDRLREVRRPSRRVCFTYATGTWGSENDVYSTPTHPLRKLRRFSDVLLTYAADTFRNANRGGNYLTDSDYGPMFR